MGTFVWIWRTVRDFLARNQANAVEAYSAQASLFVIISFFPFAIIGLALLPHLPLTQAQITGVFAEIVPEAIASFARSVVDDLYAGSSVSLISITVVLALWSSSKGSIALMRGLDRIYGVRRTRGYLFVRLMASLYVLIFFVLLIMLLAFLGFGGIIFNWLSQWIPVLKTSVFVKGSLQVLVSMAVLFVVFLLMYVTIPQHRTNLLREMPGALVAAGGWVGFSSLYSLYLDNIGGFSVYYGSLSLVVFSLLWLYFCMYIFFVGAEVNVWIRENWPSHKKGMQLKKEKDVSK